MQSTVQVNIRLPERIATAVADRAEERGWTQRTMYLWLLAEALDLTPDEFIDLLQPPKPRRTARKALASAN